MQFTPRAPYQRQSIKIPPILTPITEEDVYRLEHVMNWHKARSDLKGDGKRHRMIAEKISKVLYRDHFGHG